jgi:hypothetical protein
MYGEGTLLAATWVADQKHALVHHGPAPVLAALRAFADLPEQEDALVRRTCASFTTHAARMDYPAFIARQFPIGSGAIERACTLLITQREKQAGMRWSSSGAQHIASLRALSRSAHGRWETFWARHPLSRRSLVDALAPPVSAAPAVPTPDPPAPPALDASPAAPAPTVTRIAPAGKPWAKGKDFWRRQPICHARTA